MLKKLSLSPSLNFLYSLVSPHLPKLIFATIFLVGGAAVNLAFPEIIRRSINQEGSVSLLTNPTPVIELLLVLIILQAIFGFGRAYLFMVIGQDVVADLRSKLYQKLVLQSIAFFDREKVGDLLSRLSSDTILIQNALSVNLSVIARYTLQVAVGIVLMTLISIKLTLAIILSLPLLVCVSMILGKKLKTVSKQVQTELGQASSIAQESLAAVRTVKAFSQEQEIVKRYINAISRSLKLGVKRSIVSAFFQSFASFLMYLTLLVVTWFGIQLVGADELAFGDLTGFMLYGTIVAVSFAFLASTYAEFMQALGGVQRVLDILKVDSEDQRLGIILGKVAGELEFKNVHFAYPSRAETQVLKGISFKVSAGQTVALVGPSGAGKSTIAQLLLKFYLPSSGQIYIDGSDLSNVNTASLRQKIAIVPQETELFSISIADNLKIAKLDATKADLIEVCKKVNLYDFIESLPQGFQTEIGDRGFQLSGGQKQRLAIARVLLRNPKLLILDEATSALDSSNEAFIQNSLEELTHERTTLVIAHRLSTVKRADTVLVLNHGDIVQVGTHESLRNQTGLYKELVERQELG